LYKLQSASWGIDYVTSAMVRTANKDNGFRPENLQDFIRKGGFWFLPNRLENFDIDWDKGQHWPEYVTGTQKLCERFATKASKFAIEGYLMLFMLFSLLPRKQHRLRCIAGALLRVGMIVIAAEVILQTAKARVDQTDWAADIRAGRRYTSTAESELVFSLNYKGPSTFPTKWDVLFETRYGSEQLAMYNDFITTGHPGNRFFRELVEKAAPVYSGYTPDFKDATARFITEIVATNHGRFLYQGPDGYWMWLDHKDTINHVKRELGIASNRLTTVLMQTARFIESNYKYGILRESALAIEHAVPFLDTMRARLLNEKIATKLRDAKPKLGENLKYFRAFSLPPSKSNARRVRRLQNLHANPVVEPPYVGAWLAEGDVAESFAAGAWYYCVIQSVTAFGKYKVIYPDESYLIVDRLSIRPFQEH
jgi:hypothetical protein